MGSEDAASKYSSVDMQQVMASLPFLEGNSFVVFLRLRMMIVGETSS